MKQKQLLSEDWFSVAAGFVIIAFSLLFKEWSPELPMFFGAKEQWIAEDFFAGFFSNPNLLKLIYIFAAFGLVAYAGRLVTGKSTRWFVISFVFVFLLALIAQIIASHTSMKSLSLETVLFSVLLGLVAGNVFRLPEWLKPAVQSEFYIKIGLVLLGTSVLFSSLVKAGALGMIQALVVVVAVWYFAFWLARKLKVDDEMAVMLSSAVSICGVSAAIASAGAIKGDSKKLSYVISLVLIVAIPMMIFMPYLAKWIGLTPEVAGAWLGGTIDTTGAVVASGTILGETAKEFAVIIKSAQNVLLGLAAFAISIYWAYRKKETDERPSGRVIWERFPKFVLGFILASLLFSFFIQPELVKTVKDTIKGYQNIWFSLAFVCIGLETRFSDVFNKGNSRSAWAFLIAQVVNIAFTLIIAYLLFGNIF